VVLVTMDTTRRDALSVYGGRAEASPNIQRLAGSASVYENAWASSPWTLPSHASIFTGMHPSRHGAGVTEPRLLAGIPTVAATFREAGFRTVGFAGGEMSASHWGVAQGFESFYNPEGFETRGGRLNELIQPVLRDAHMEPLFLFVNYFDPHALYDAPARHRSVFQVEELGRRLGSLQPWEDLAAGKNRAFREIVYSEVEVPEAALDYLRAAYLAEVAFMDQQIGRLVRTLRERKLYDNATIVLVADHGEFLGEGGFFSHGCRLDPELTHVPLIVKWPHQRHSERVGALASHVDIFPTLVEAAGLQPVMTEGLSLSSRARDELQRRQAVVMEEHDSRIHPLIERMMIARHLFGFQRTDHREVVWQGGSSCERWTAEGWAAEPCAESWEARLAQLEHFAAAAGEPKAEGSEDALSGEMRERLEALGYLR
jgi:arylsulfatase A-like enzyme